MQLEECDDQFGKTGEAVRRVPAACGRLWLVSSWARVEGWLAHRLAGWLMVGVLAVIYTVAYLQHPLFPSKVPTELRTGWWTWADQFVYWNSAAELAEFRLTAANAYYASGYPALGAFFMKFMPVHPFFVPNLCLVLGAAAVWWRLARRGLSRLQTLLIGTVFVVAHRTVLALTLVIPWNTIATQLTLLAGMWIMVSTRGPRAVWRLTALAALTYLVRPGDAACFAPMLIWAVLRLPLWREKLICAAGGMAAIGAVMLAVGLVNRAVFGTWDTPYERMTWQAIGFFSYPATHKLFWIFVDGRPFFGETDTGLIFRYPWLLLVVPGVFYWIRTEGMAAVAALAALGLNWWLYLNYNDFFPSGIFRYSLIHYLVWGFAPLFALSVAAVVHGWRQRVTQLGLVAALALAVLVLGLQMDPQVLPVTGAAGSIERLPTARSLWIHFPGVPLEKVQQLKLDGRALQENRDYQIPYVPSDLRMLLSSGAQGTVVTVPAEGGITVAPVVGTYVWRWRFDRERLRGLWSAK